MAVTNQQILDFLIANPGMSDAQIVAAMEQYGVSPAQMASAVGLPVGEVISRVAAVVPEGQSITLGDTRIAPQYQVVGSGEDRQVGGIENITVEKTTGDVNYRAPVGSTYQNYSPTGELTGTGTTTSSGQTSFFGGLVDALKDPVVLAALGGAAYGGLLGGAGTAAGSGLGAGSSLGTGLTAGAGGLGLSTTGAGLGALGTGAGITTGAGLTGTGILTGSALGTGLLGTATGALTGTGILSGSGLGTELLGTGAGTGVTGALNTGVGAGTLGAGALTTGLEGLTSGLSGVGTGLTSGLSGLGSNLGAGLGAGLSGIGTGLTNAALANLISTGLTTSAGLLQQQTSKEAAQKAQQQIDAETAAAKQAAMFRPVGMTTRFGTSQFQVDPTTGQITSAGYTLSPEAKAAQDRLVNLAGAGLTQAEGAQKAFEPLQTGAQSLFKLGAGYLAQSPEDVAKNYMTQQLALLKPGRELELANLQNKLQQQGRAGLSVAQGGTYGATTPELQALYNARAMQEAQLAAQAQQAGQQQVQFGAGLLGQGAGTLGQYYAGQQAAYAPYTTALGQVQALETAAQQPFTMGVGLGQTAAQAGANVGRLGLAGAGESVQLATGQAATNNPYSSLLSGLGGSNTFGTAIGGLLSGGISGLQSAFSQTPLGSSGFGTGLAYGNQDYGLYL